MQNKLVWHKICNCLFACLILNRFSFFSPYSFLPSCRYLLPRDRLKRQESFNFFLLYYLNFKDISRSFKILLTVSNLLCQPSLLHLYTYTGFNKLCKNQITSAEQTTIVKVPVGAVAVSLIVLLVIFCQWQYLWLG